MAIDFPTSPIINQTYSSSNKIWKWDGVSWSTFTQKEKNIWTRNSAWLELPILTDADQKFAGLLAVYEAGSNYVALSAEGNYTVNWGDGTGNSNVNSGVTAEANISWANAATTSDVGIADAVSCTFQDSGDTVTVTSHNFSNGERIAFNTINTTTGISTYTTYYVRDVSGDTFKVESSIGGGVISLTTNGTGSVYRTKYRQVIVTIIPNGSNLTKLNLHTAHSAYPARDTATQSQFLDIVISGQYLTELILGAYLPGDTQGIANIKFSNLEQVNIVKSSIKNLAGLFKWCNKLKSILNISCATIDTTPIACTYQNSADTVTINNHGFSNTDTVFLIIEDGTLTGPWYVRNKTQNTFQLSDGYSSEIFDIQVDGSGSIIRGILCNYMFDDCNSLISIPYFDTSSCISTTGMFRYCYSLVNVPLFNFSNCLKCDNMFADCNSLISIPMSNFSNSETTQGMFTYCYNLTTIPSLDTSSSKSFEFMFQGCYSLTSIPQLNTSNSTNFSCMFADCVSLKSIPQLNTSNGVYFGEMFRSCESLELVPLLDTSSGTDTHLMFAGCVSLPRIPLLDTSQVTDVNNMFSRCTNLHQLPNLDFSSVNTSTIGEGGA